MTTFNLKESMIKFDDGELFIEFVDNHSYKKEVNKIKIEKINFRKYEETYTGNSFLNCFSEVIFEFDLKNLYRHDYRWLENVFPYFDVDSEQDKIFLIDNKKIIIDLHNFLQQSIQSRHYKVETILL